MIAPSPTGATPGRARRHPVKILPVRLSGGELPALLADIKFADLVTDRAAGMRSLLRAIR
jgi:hypothetical protein